MARRHVLEEDSASVFFFGGGGRGSASFQVHLVQIYRNQKDPTFVSSKKF